MSRALRLTPPEQMIDAVVHVPGSKSVANRAIVCAMLARSPSTIEGVPDGDDTSALLEVLRSADGAADLNGASLVVNPVELARIPSHIDARLAGTTSRFLTAVGSLCPHTVVIDGGEPLRRRPMGPLHHALRELGASPVHLGRVDHLPVQVGGATLAGGRVVMRGDTSSQFISALMLIGPCLPGGLTIEFDGPLVSRPYVEMTARVMMAFGADVDMHDTWVTIDAGGYQGVSYRVEPDFSSAAFPIASVLLRGGRVRCVDLASATLQGDAQILAIAEQMGAQVAVDGDDILVSSDGTLRPRPITVDMANCSDLVPVVALACAVADGRSLINGVGFIRHKESNRLNDLAEELRKVGASVEVSDDGLVIDGRNALVPARIDPRHDHRLAMSLSLSALSSGEVVISDPDVVSKSWPTFFKDMEPIVGAAVTAN